MKNKFKIGDRIVGVGIQSGRNIDGKLGTIKRVYEKSYGVEFDETNPAYHSLDGLLKGKKSNNGLYVVHEQLRLANLKFNVKDEVLINHKKFFVEKALEKGIEIISDGQNKFYDNSKVLLVARKNLL